MSICIAKHRANERHGISASHVFALFVFVLLAFNSIAHGQVPASQPVSALESSPLKRPHATTPIAPEPAPFSIQRLVMAMSIVLSLIFVLRYAVGWMFPGMKTTRSSRAVRVLARTTIAPRQQVMLLQVGRRVVIVGDSGGTLSSLGHIEEPDEVAEIIGGMETVEAPAVGGRFSTLFGRAKEELDTTLVPEAPAPTEVTADQEGQIDEARTEISSLINRMRALTQIARRD